jgi:hypothetical protein
MAPVWPPEILPIGLSWTWPIFSGSRLAQVLDRLEGEALLVGPAAEDLQGGDLGFCRGSSLGFATLYSGYGFFVVAAGRLIGSSGSSVCIRLLTARHVVLSSQGRDWQAGNLAPKNLK